MLKLRTFLGQGYSKQSHGGGGSPCDCLEFLTSLCLLCLSYTICSLCKHDVRIYPQPKAKQLVKMHLKAAGLKGAVPRGNKMCASCGLFSVFPLYVASNCSCCWHLEGPRLCFFSHASTAHVLKFRCNQSDSCWIMPFYGLHRQWFLGIIRIRSAQHNIAWESETCVIFPRKSLHVVIRNHRQSCSVTPTVSG